MLRKWLQAYLAQPKQEPTKGEVMDRLDAIERKQKRFEGELDEELQKVRALNARMTRMLDRAAQPEKPAQDPPGSTIDPRQVPLPLPDKWATLREYRAQQRGAQ